MNTCQECGLAIDYDLRQDGEGTEAYHVASGLTECSWSRGGTTMAKIMGAMEMMKQFTPSSESVLISESALIFDKEAINDYLTRAAVNVTESLLQWSKYPNNARRDLMVARDRISHAIDLLTKELDK